MKLLSMLLVLGLGLVASRPLLAENHLNSRLIGAEFRELYHPNSLLICELNTKDLQPGTELAGFCKLNGLDAMDLKLDEENVAFLKAFELYSDALVCDGVSTDPIAARSLFKRSLNGKLKKLCQKAAKEDPAFARSAEDFTIGFDATRQLEAHLPIQCRKQFLVQTP